MNADPPRQEIVGVYGRASLDKKELRISTSRQIERGTRLAETTWPGCQTVIFEDNNLSASNPDVDRPGYQQLVADIRRGRLTQVVVHEQSRLTRQPAQWDELVVALSRAGIDQVHTVLRGTVPVAEGNRLVGRIMAVVDADESERLRLRALAMHDHLAAGGRPNGGRYYGYRRQIGLDGRPRLIVHDPEAQVVRRIVDGLMAGKSSHQLAAELNGDRIPTGRPAMCRGCRRSLPPEASCCPGCAAPGVAPRWRANTVLQLARRPHIAGLRQFRGRLGGDAAWEPIIGRERWELLQARINSNPHRGEPYRARRWLLTGGLARCGVCANPMVANKQPRVGGNIDALICSPRGDDACGRVSLSPMQTIEEIIVEAALQVLESPRLVEAVTDDDGGVRGVLSEQLRAAEGRVARAAELFGAGEIDEVTWRRMHTPAAASAAAARAELAALAGPGVDLPPPDRIRSEWGGLTVAQKRQALAWVIEKVTVLPSTGRRPADGRQRVLERLDITWRN